MLQGFCTYQQTQFIASGPDGCLQYFTGTTGTVSSFNFPTTTSTVGSMGMLFFTKIFV